MRRNFGLSILKFVAFCLIFFGGSLEAYAQNIADYISIAPTEPWVEVQPIPSEAFALSADQKLTYKLLSYQYRVSKSDYRYYHRRVVDLQNASAVEENGTITVTFDPSYKKIKFHHIQITNSDGTRDVLNLTDADLFRTETDRDKLLYDGTLQFSLALKGVQVGDRLEYAYTSYGRNPALGDGYFMRHWQAYSTPVQHLFQRAVIDEDMPIHTKRHHEAKAPVKTTSNGQVVFSSSLRDVAGISGDENSPSWYYGNPAVEISSYGSWPEVGNHFAPYYRLSGKLDPDIQAVVDEIQQDTSDPKEQTRQALNYVQENIRYLGLEMGVGGFKPRPSSLVFDRRFGDCKDVTLLLLSMLNALNIEADPVLVHSTERAGFLIGQPHHWAFDHVVVRAEIAGKSYVLDATRGKQLGTLDKLDQGHFQKGLRLREQASEIIDLPHTAYEWRKDFYDEFDITAHDDDILYTLTARYFGEEADSNYEWFLDDGLAEIEKQFHEYFVDLYPSLIIEKPTEVEVDEDEASFTVKAYYRIVDGWEKDEEENEKTIWAVPYELRAGFPVFSGAKRSAPYAIPYPAKNRQILAYKVDEDAAFDEANLPYTTDAFDYREVNRFKNQLYEEIYTYEAKQEFIAAEDAPEVLSFVNETRDDFGLTIYDAINPGSLDHITEEQWGQIFIAVFLFVGFIGAILAAIFAQNHDREWREELVFHPVPMPKFLILSFITIGHFQIYWIYKNWLWIKTVLKEDIWPIPRAIFASFMNFALFPRIAEEGDPKHRYAWYSALSIPLAILFFLAAMLDRAVNRIPTLPDWLSIISLVSILVIVPVAMQVNKYNFEKPELVAKNGKYRWTSWLLIAGYTPIALAVYFGTIMVVMGIE